MNGKKHAEQFENAMLKLYRDYSAFCGRFVPEFKVVLAGGTTKGVKSDINEVLSENNGVIICLGNGSQLKNVMDQITQLDEVEFDLFVDEADDYFDKPAHTIYDTYLEQLKEFARKKFCVTATALSLVFSEKEMINRLTFEIPKHPNYIGIEQIDFVELPHVNHINLNNGLINYFDADPNVREFYLNLGRQAPYRTQPIICLHKTTRFVDQHTEFINTFSTDNEFKHKWTVITFNGDGVTLYSDSLRGIKVEIEVRIAKRNKINEVGKEIAVGDMHANTGVHVFEKAPLRNVLKYLRHHTVVTHILIVSGDLASRGINFVDAEYKWHLSHMYYISPSESTLETHRIQAMRCCGVFEPDGIIPKVYAYASDIIRIKAAYDIQKHLFEQMLNMKNECIMNDVYVQVGVKKSLASKVKLSRHKYKLNVISDQAFNRKYLNPIDEKEEKKEVEKNGKYLLIQYSKLPPAYQKIYHDFVLYIENYKTGTWIKRANFSANNIIRARLTEMCQKYSIKCNKNAIGLIAKKPRNEWFFKLNKN